MDEPVSLDFQIPARDALGHLHVKGRLQATASALLVHWKLRQRTFQRAGQELHTVSLEYGDIERVTLKRRLWLRRTLVLQVGDPRLLEAIPGAALGRLDLAIDSKSRAHAGRFERYLEFKRSEALLERRRARLNTLRDSGEAK